MTKPPKIARCGGALQYESIAGTRIYRDVGGHHRYTARCDKCGLTEENDGKPGICTRTVAGPLANAPDKLSRVVVVARRDGTIWNLTLACGHRAEETAKRQRGVSGNADNAFKPPPTRMRCAECERRNAAEPTLF